MARHEQLGDLLADREIARDMLADATKAGAPSRLLSRLLDRFNAAAEAFGEDEEAELLALDDMGTL